MDRGSVSSRIAALRAECTELGRELVERGRSLDAEEAFEVAGELQTLVTAAEGAQAVAAAHGARVELRLTDRGPVERIHELGFVDAMAPSTLALEAGLTEGVAGRKVGLGAALCARFPSVRDLVVAGDVPVASAHKVVDACAGLDVDACAAVDRALGPRLAALDPARVSSESRRVAAGVAADQVAAQADRTRRGRAVEVRPGEDGLTEWWATLPTATSAAAWSAVEELATTYRAADSTLSVPESRADAFGDLLLGSVDVAARVTLGVPVVTGVPEPEPLRTERVRVDRDPDEIVVDSFTGRETRFGDLDAHSQEELSWVETLADEPPEVATAVAPLPSGAAVSGTYLAGLGWVDARTVAGLLRTLPMEVARAVLDADTGTQLSVTGSAYRPSETVRDFVETRDGTCRMWGCSRPAERCDLDHTRPWPAGSTGPTNLVALCRRHHRFKQQGRWRPSLDSSGTVTWTDPRGRTRTTEPLHRVAGDRPPEPG